MKTLIYLWASWQQQLPWQFQINQIPPAFPSAVTVVGQEVSQAEGRAATASSPTAPARGWLGLSCKATAWLLRSYGCSLVLALQHLRLLQSSTGSSPQHPPCPQGLANVLPSWGNISASLWSSSVPGASLTACLPPLPTVLSLGPEPSSLIYRFFMAMLCNNWKNHKFNNITAL